MEEINVPSSPLSSLSSLSSIGSSPSPSPELRPIQPPTKLESPVSNLKSPMKQSQRLKRPAKPSISVSELLVDYSHWDFRIGNLTIDQADKILQEEENEKEDLEDYISRQDFIKQSTELDKEIQNLISKKLPKSIKKAIMPDTEVISNNIASKKNHTTCSVCDSEGDMVCCDGCPRSFHFSCFVPPLDSNNLPEGHWYCYACVPRKIERKSSSVLSNKLLDGVSKLNPSCFEVPQTLISEFQGLIQSREGDFVDNRRARTDKKRSNEPRNNWDNIILKSMDNNPPKACFWCKKSRLVDPIIQCDYCPLNWHLCCLNPPLSEPPRPDKKFMCPHHVEHNLGPIWKREYNPYSLTIEEDERESKKIRLTDTNIDSWINNTQLKIDNIKFTQDESELIARVFCDKANQKIKSKEKNPVKLPTSNGKSSKHIADDEVVIKKVKEKRKSEPSGPPSAFESKLKHLFKNKVETQPEPSQPELPSEEIDTKAILKEYLDFPKLPKIHSKLMNKEPKELIHMLKSIKK